MNASLEDTYDQLQAMYQQSTLAQQQFSAVDEHIKKLQKMGEAVSSKDVVKAMGSMIADGHVDPKVLASVASTMPAQDGTPLVNWLAQRRQIFDAKLQEGAQHHETLRNALSKVSFQLMQKHIVSGGQPQASSPAQAPQPGPGNALMPGAGGQPNAT